MADLLVYAVGDSVMWGEGIRDQDKFATRAAVSLAQARGLEPKLKLLAHAGAKIKATRDERRRFADRFPALFNTQERTKFIGPAGAGSDFVPDESPTNQLHGEINRAFPTIHHQLRSIPDMDAERVDVLLLTGGANDIDFEEVIQTGGNFLNKLDDDYKRIFHDDVLELIAAARQRCPKAQIIFTGYYSGFSMASSFSRMKDLFLSLKGFTDEYRLLNTIGLLSTVAGLFGVVGLIEAVVIDEILGTISEQIEDSVELARATSESGESRSHHWIRRAVSEINEKASLAAIKGPGVVFASPGFRPENCAFAPDSLIWQQFEEDELDDDMRSVRASECPRNGLRDDMALMATRIRQTLSAGGTPGGNELALIPGEKLKKLANDLDGPVALRTELINLAQDIFDTNQKRKVLRLLKAEIDRIAITRIGSLLHPNREGAARYAASVHKRAEELPQVSLRDRLPAFLPPEQRDSAPDSLQAGKMIRRFKSNLADGGVTLFDPAAGVKDCLKHAEPDVIGLKVRTHLTSDFFSSEVFLDLGSGGRRKLRQLLMTDLTGDLELNPHLRPGTVDFFTIDVSGQIRIGDITQAVIEIEKDPSGPTWRPESITLSIDGLDVHKVAFEEPPAIGRRLDLGFPN